MSTRWQRTRSWEKDEDNSIAVQNATISDQNLLSIDRRSDSISIFRECWVSLVADLQLPELLPVVEDLYEKGFADPRFQTLDGVHSAAQAFGLGAAGFRVRRREREQPFHVGEVLFVLAAGPVVVAEGFCADECLQSSLPLGDVSHIEVPGIDDTTALFGRNGKGQEPHAIDFKERQGRLDGSGGKEFPRTFHLGEDILQRSEGFGVGDFRHGGVVGVGEKEEGFG